MCNCQRQIEDFVIFASISSSFYKQQLPIPLEVIVTIMVKLIIIVYFGRTKAS